MQFFYGDRDKFDREQFLVNTMDEIENDLISWKLGKNLKGQKTVSYQTPFDTYVVTELDGCFELKTLRNPKATIVNGNTIDCIGKLFLLKPENLRKRK